MDVGGRIYLAIACLKCGEAPVVMVMDLDARLHGMCQACQDVQPVTLDGCMIQLTGVPHATDSQSSKTPRLCSMSGCPACQAASASSTSATTASRSTPAHCRAVKGHDGSSMS